MRFSSCSSMEIMIPIQHCFRMACQPLNEQCSLSLTDTSCLFNHIYVILFYTIIRNIPGTLGLHLLIFLHCHVWDRSTNQVLSSQALISRKKYGTPADCNGTQEPWSADRNYQSQMYTLYIPILPPMDPSTFLGSVLGMIWAFSGGVWIHRADLHRTVTPSDGRWLLNPMRTLLQHS